MKLVCASINVEYRSEPMSIRRTTNRVMAMPGTLSEVVGTAVIPGKPSVRPGDYATLTAPGSNESVNVMVTSVSCTVPHRSGALTTEIQFTASNGDFDPKKNERFKFYVRLDDDVVAIADKRTEEIAWHAEHSSESSKEAFRVVEELNEAALVEHMEMIADDQCMGCPIENFQSSK